MLYKRPGSKNYWTRFTDPNGATVRRSTGTAIKADAEQFEAKLKRELYQIQRLGERPVYTWQQAVVRWLDQTKHKVSRADDLAALRWLDPILGDLTLTAITRDQLESIQQRKLATGVTHATVNRTLQLVCTILNNAAAWGWIDHAPRLKHLPEPKRRIRWLSRDQSDRLLAELPDHLADMMRLSLATGLRESNITGLRWDQLDLPRRVAWIHADQSKNKQALGVPLNRNALAVIERWQGRHPTHVFCYKDQPIKKAGGAAWRKALARAGIKDFRWHDLRHTWASWHVQAGTPLHVLQELGGWQSIDMVRRYAHLAPEHLAQWADRAAL